MGADAQPCADSFAFISSAPLVVQQPPTHQLLVVIPVRRDCCSWQCDSSVRVTYFTAPTSTSIEPARPGVDFVEGRGSVLFDVGQQRALVAVEILPALVGDWKSSDSVSPSQRAFAMVLEAPVNASALAHVSTEIIIEPTLVHKHRLPPPARSTMSTPFNVVGILAAVTLVALAGCWFRVRHCSCPRRARPFEYKVLLLPRRDSGPSEEVREALAPTSSRRTKNGARRSARRVSSFTSWRAGVDRHRQDVVPEVEVGEQVEIAAEERVQDAETSEDHDSEPERDLREHLASIQSASRPLGPTDR